MPIKNYCIYIICTILGYIIERLALVICLKKPSLALVLGMTSWVVTEHNLWSFGAKGYKIRSPPLNIPNNLLRVDPIHCLERRPKSPSDKPISSMLHIICLLFVWSARLFCSVCYIKKLFFIVLDIIYLNRWQNYPSDTRIVLQYYILCLFFS